MDTQPIYPRAGQRMPDFSLVASDGLPVRTSKYRGRRNLVLAFVDGTGCDPCRGWLSNMAGDYEEVLRHEAQVLVVVHGSLDDAGEVKRANNLPFPVLADVDGAVHRRVGAVTPGGQPAMAVYVVDRFGEIFNVSRTGEGDTVPAPEEVLDWLQFIEIQCPE